jgi:malate dehydrogenase (oxaloacetate-decarboxylating)(NADP+)
VDEGIAAPILIGDEREIRSLGDEVGIGLDGVQVLEPRCERDRCSRYAEALFALRSRKGMTPEDAGRALADPSYFAAMMLQQGDTDAVIGGLTTYYPETLRPALQVLPLEQGRTIVSAVYVVMIGRRAYFLADCAVNVAPSAEQLAEIALATAAMAHDRFNIQPRVALISYSNFGSVRGPEPNMVRRAVEICHENEPDLPLDGEMQADIAVAPNLLARRYFFNRLGSEANVLVFPNLTAANAAYKLLGRLGGAEIIGPILSGFSKSVHVLQRDAEVGDIVNLTAVAVLDAQRKRNPV